MPMSSVKKILLAKMTKVRADILSDGAMVVDDESNVGPLQNRENHVSQSTNFIHRRRFGSELNQICATVAQLLDNLIRCPAVQVSCIQKGIEPAFGKRLHREHNSSRGSAPSQSLSHFPSACR